MDHVDPSIIDVHAHVSLPDYSSLLRAAGLDLPGYEQAVFPAPTPSEPLRPAPSGADPSSIERRLEHMDRAGVARQVLSPTVGPYAADQDSARRAARLVNTTHAALVAAHPDRFSFFAALPLPHVDAALDEVEHALDTLDAVGVIIHCSVGGRSVADPAFEPVLAELDRRGGALFLHPSVNGLRSPLVTDWGLAPTAGTVFEDTVAALHLMTARVSERFPGIDIIVPHLGGALPMLLHRLDNQLPMSVPGLTERPSETARRFWYDTVAHGSAAALRAAVEAFGADRLLAGSDYPVMLPFNTYAQTMAHHDASGLTPDVLSRILRTNARQLFGGL
ncbi:MAG: amidohydrolase [Kytococcus sp.]|nr:amidohydrolase [Kytococcus sp.]